MDCSYLSAVSLDIVDVRSSKGIVDEDEDGSLRRAVSRFGVGVRDRRRE